MILVSMNWLTKYRQDNNVSQVDLAETLGVSQASISMWEAGTRKPSTPAMLQKIESVLGIPRYVVRPDLYLGVDPKSLSAPADAGVG